LLVYSTEWIFISCAYSVKYSVNLLTSKLLLEIQSDLEKYIHTTMMQYFHNSRNESY